MQKVITERIPRIISAPRNSGERIIFIILEDNGIAGMFHFRIRQSPFEYFCIKNAPSKERSGYVDQDMLTGRVHAVFLRTTFIASMPFWKGIWTNRLGRAC